MDNNVAYIERSSVILQGILGEPLWWRYVTGETNCLIERYISHTPKVCGPALPDPVLLVHLGGRRISQQGVLGVSSEQLVSLPSVATLLPSGVESEWVCEGGQEFAVLYFCGASLAVLRKYTQQFREPVALQGSLCCSLTKELADTLGKATGEGLAVQQRHHYIQALAHTLLQHIVYSLNNPLEQSQVSAASSQSRYIQTALDYITHDLTQPLRAEDIAAHVGLHPSHLRKVFSQVVGVPLHRYVLQKRLERSRELLINSSLCLSEIAEQVGFSSQSHMASSFRKIFNVTPTDLRQLHNAREER